MKGRAEYGVLRAVNEAMADRRSASCLRQLAGASDAALKVISKQLDLPQEDAETVDFLRQALASAASELDDRKEKP